MTYRPAHIPSPHVRQTKADLLREVIELRNKVIELNTRAPDPAIAALQAEVARWQQLYEDARHDLTKAEMEVERLREALAGWMLKNSYATGHGDTFDDLLSELDWQHAKMTNP